MILTKRLLAVAASMAMGTMTAQAEVDQQLAIAIGKPGSESFMFGTELWAMGQIALLPNHGIALGPKEVAIDADRLDLLNAGDVDAALFRGRVPEPHNDDVRSIMALWPKGVSNERIEPVQLLVRKGVGADVVYLLTKAMFEYRSYFRSVHASLGVGQPSHAVTGLDMPLHEGAHRFFEESGLGLGKTVVAEEEPAAEPVLATATYRNFDDGALKKAEIEQIAAACRQALELGSLLPVLGDLSTTGCEAYQELLLDDVAGGQKRPATASLPSDAGSAFATTVDLQQETDEKGELLDAAVGQGGPAIRWEPGQANGLMPLPVKREARQPVM